MCFGAYVHIYICVCTYVRVDTRLGPPWNNDALRGAMGDVNGSGLGRGGRDRAAAGAVEQKVSGAPLHSSCDIVVA